MLLWLDLVTARPEICISSTPIVLCLAIVALLKHDSSSNLLMLYFCSWSTASRPKATSPTLGCWRSGSNTIRSVYRSSAGIASHQPGFYLANYIATFKPSADFNLGCFFRAMFRLVEPGWSLQSSPSLPATASRTPSSPTSSEAAPSLTGFFYDPNKLDFLYCSFEACANATPRLRMYLN